MEPKNNKEFSYSNAIIEKVRGIVKRRKTTLQLFETEVSEIQNKNNYVMVFRWNTFKNEYDNRGQLENTKIAITKNVYLVDIALKFFTEIEKVEYFKIEDERLKFTKMTQCVFLVLILIWFGLIYLMVDMVGSFGGLAAGITVSALVTVLIFIISDYLDKISYGFKIKSRAREIQQVSDDYNKRFLEYNAYNLDVSQYGGVIKIIKNLKFQHSLISQGSSENRMREINSIKDNKLDLQLLGHDSGEKSTNRTSKNPPNDEKAPKFTKKSRSKSKLMEDRSQNSNINDNKISQKASNTSSLNANYKDDININLKGKPKKKQTKKFVTDVGNENQQADPHNDSAMAMINVKDYGDQGHVADNEDFEFSEDREVAQRNAGHFGVRQNNQRSNNQMGGSNEFSTKDHITNVEIMEKSYESNEKKHNSQRNSTPNTLRIDSRYINSSRLGTKD